MKAFICILFTFVQHRVVDSSVSTAAQIVKRKDAGSCLWQQFYIFNAGTIRGSGTACGELFACAEKAGANHFPSFTSGINLRLEKKKNASGPFI